MTSEMMPCPFCGEPGSVRTTQQEPHLFSVGCEKCWSHIDTFYSDLDKAIAAWNTRASHAALKAALEEAVREFERILYWHRTETGRLRERELASISETIQETRRALSEA